jgi:hypothetical protein
MITEMDWIKHSSPEYFSRTFSYAENFLFAPQNIRNFETDSSVLWFADLMLLAMLLISIPSAVLLFKNRHTLSRFSISVALIFFVSVLMTTALSRAIWDNLFFLQKAQFPWRWLGIVAMSGAVFAAFGIMRLAAIMSENKNRLLTIGLGATLAFYAFMSAFVVKQAVYLSKGQFDGQLQNIESAQGFDCWQTIWAKVGAFKIKEKLVAENRETRILKWDSTEKEFEVSAGDAVTIRTATFFYPHWRAAVNGENVAIEKDDDGAILIPLPAKFSSVNLYFAEPAFVRFANYLSIFCWIIFLYAFVFLLIKSRSTSD